MFKRKILKVLALVLVLNILIIPLTSFCPQEQNKYVVHAEGETIVNSLFLTAILTMFAITAFQNNSITENFKLSSVNLASIKGEFQEKLNANPEMAEEWMKYQTKWLADGLAFTMTAQEAGKAGLYNLYQTFINYMNPTNVSNISSIEQDVQVFAVNGRYYSVINRVGKVRDCDRGVTITLNTPYNSDGTEFELYINNYENMSTSQVFTKNQSNASQFINTNTQNNKVILYPISSLIDQKILRIYPSDSDGNWITNSNGTLVNYIMVWVNSSGSINFDMLWDKSVEGITKDNLRDTLSLFMAITGVNILKTGDLFTTVSSENTGVITTDPLVLTDDVINTVTTVPSVTNITDGIILNPGLIDEYAGAVPIDVPISVPIDPTDPTDPIDPPIEDDPTLIGTVAAILAGILPISGILDNIITGIDDIADVITAGITGVIDGIGDIAGTITGGITSTLTDIQTSINDLINPSPENVEELDLNPVKNIPAVFFSRFPFSIPFDFYNIMAYMGGSAREAPVFKFIIPLSSIGQEDVEKSIDMQPFDQIAGYVRMAELIAFSIAIMLKTKTLVWG